MTEIEERYKETKELLGEDLRFLYEIDSKIEGLRHKDGPRIEELLEGRDKRSDLSLFIGRSPEEISLTQEEALSGGIKYHYGNLILNGLSSAEGLVLPKNIGGDLFLNSLSRAEGLNLPEHMEGNLILNGLSSAEGLNLPERIGGYLYLNGLKSAEGLVLPKNIGGDLYLNGLSSAEGLNLPEHMEGSLSLNRIKTCT